MTVHPATVRPIEYEIMPRSDAARVELPDIAAQHVRAMRQVALVRCVDEQGEKLTAIGDAEHLHELLASGEAGNPAGIKLAKQGFPVLVRGWLRAG